MGPTIIESDIHVELTDLLMAIMPELGFETVWLAPGVGPVKIETPNGIAELIDDEIYSASGKIALILGKKWGLFCGSVGDSPCAVP